MANAQMNHSEEARHWLGQATDWMQKNMKEPQKEQVHNSYLTWAQRLELQELAREARLLIQFGG